VDRPPRRELYPPSSRPIRVEGGLRAKSRRGAIGETWWSRRFVGVLEQFHEEGRLERGRAYARAGQVIRLEIEPGVISATVQGSRRTPYRVTIKVKKLSDKEWRRVEDTMAAKAVFLARLLAGEMPERIEDAFTVAGLSLFPSTARDLRGECSCPDWGNPCKHVAAVYYLVGEAFDDDPFLIFRWRGRSRERLLEELRDARRGSAEAGGRGAVGAGAGIAEDAGAAATIGVTGAGRDGPSESDRHDLPIDRFWLAGPELGELHIEPRAADLPDAVLRELEPATLAVLGADLPDVLRPAYRAFTDRAARLAVAAPAAAGPIVESKKSTRRRS
jgi:uncharacterized Zn finger protein